MAAKFYTPYHPYTGSYSMMVDDEYMLKDWQTVWDKGKVIYEDDVVTKKKRGGFEAWQYTDRGEIKVLIGDRWGIRYTPNWIPTG